MLKFLSSGGIARTFRHRHYRNFIGDDGISLVGSWI